ncbi:MAG: hypothetical protein ACYTG0_04325 [Planctomycetota bacterium]|jgi:hypothetical protein
MNLRRWIVLLTVFAVAGAGVAQRPVHSADDETRSDGRGHDLTLRFLRVYIPADRLDERPKDNIRYVPIEADKFERLVSRIQRMSGPNAAATGAAIASAEYEARIEDDAFLSGGASLRIDHLAEGPTILPLKPCGLAVGEATWSGDGSPIARVGLAGDVNQGVLVKKSGRLTFNWWLRGRRDATGAVEFLWEVPPCPASRLVLNLPENLTPTSDQGIVIRKDRPGSASPRWRIELGGHHRARIRVAPKAVSEEQLLSTRVRQVTAYDVSLGEVSLNVEWQLDVLGEPIERITAVLDPGLRLVSARYIGARPGLLPLDWTIPSSTADDGKRRAVLEFPEPVRGSERVVRLEAVAPIDLARRWRLPRIWPEGVFWEGGRATLSVSEPLRLEQLHPLDGRQMTKIGPLPPPRSGETVQIQHFMPDASTEVVLVEHEVPLQVDCGTTIHFGPGETTALVAADVRSIGVEQFHVSADVSPDWEIDAVESSPADRLADWSVEKAGSGRVLVIRLAEALRQSPPGRIQVAAHRPLPPGRGSFGIDDVAPIRFRGAAAGRRLTWLRAPDACDLEVTPDADCAVDPRSLNDAALALFAEPPHDPLLENVAGIAGLQVSLKRREPRYSAAIRVEATVAGDSLVETYRFRCVPEQLRVDRVIVGFFPPRTTPPRWSLGARPEKPLGARRLSPDDQIAAQATSGWELWEVPLRPPRSVPFELSATRSVSMDDRQGVRLASLPEAAVQTGTAVVYSAGPVAVDVDDRRLMPVVPDVLPAQAANVIRAAYRYDPARAVASSAEPALTVSRLPLDSAPPPCWVWDCRLESRYRACGAGRHLVTYRLENTGASQLLIRLPSTAASASVKSVWVGNSQRGWRAAVEKTGEGLTVVLPREERFPSVAVDFTTQQSPLATVGSIEPPWPQIDVPILTNRWFVWLPPGYEAADPGPSFQSSAADALSWRQRLFGVLGRRAADAPFDPTVLADWCGVVDYRPNRAAAERRAVALWKRLGQRRAGTDVGRRPDRLTWGTLLADAWADTVSIGTPRDPGKFPLLIDRLALSRMEVTAQTAVSLPPDGPSTRSVAACFPSSGLELLVHPQALVVTSASNAARQRNQLARVEDEELGSGETHNLWRVCPGPLFDRIAKIATGGGNEDLVPVDDWRRVPADPEIPWPFQPPAGFTPGDARGWTFYELNPSGEPLTFVHRDTMRVIAWAVFMAVVGLGTWTALHRTATLTALSGVFGASALLLPQIYAPIASSALLGTLFVLGFRLICRKSVGKVFAMGSTAGGQAYRRAGAPAWFGLMLLGAMAGLAIAASARGAEVKPEPSPARLPASPVLIPVDDRSQPTGEAYHVPEGLYHQLQLRAEAVAVEPQTWVLSGVTYDGALLWQAPAGRLVLGELTAVFEVDVLHPLAKVRIPTGPEGLSLKPDGARLNGAIVHPKADQGALLLDVPERGRHRLELALAPGPPTQDGVSGFDLSVPPLANARLELRLPPNAPQIDVPSAIGQVRLEEQLGTVRLVARLGPVQRLSVRWDDMADKESTVEPVVDVDELLWLTIRPGSVNLDARFKFNVMDGHVDELCLAADPRLTRSPLLDTSQSWIPPEQAVPGEPREFRIELADPVSGRFDLGAAFRLKNALGVGNLRLPYLAVRGARSTKRWLAVSIDPSLEHDRIGPALAPPKTVPASDFLDAWGDVPSAPLGVYDLSLEESPWGIATRPRETRVVVNKTIALSFSPESALVHLDTRLIAVGGYRFGYRIQAPRDLTVEHLSVLEGESEQLDRFWRDETGGIVIVLRERASEGEERRLLLRGRMATSISSEVPLPMFEVDQAELQSAVVRLYHKPNVRIDVSRAAGLTPVETPDPQDAGPSLGRLAEAYEADPTGEIHATLAISANRPKVHARQITSLRNEGNHWEAKAEFTIRFDDGPAGEPNTVAHEFLLEAPSSWSGPDPEQIEPAAAVEELDAPEEGRRRWRILPSSPIEQGRRLVVSGALSHHAGEPIAVPSITLKEVDLEEHLLVLPVRRQGHSTEWETQGLLREEVPPDIADSKEVGEAWVAFRVEGDSFRAVLRRLNGKPRVNLADVRLAWRSDGVCRGLTSFDLEPGGAPECSLRLPEGYDLVQVTVGDVPTAPVPVGPNRWRLPLGPREYPQRVEVVYSGSIALHDTSGQIRLESPMLEGRAAARTLWTVSGPPARRIARPEGPDSLAALEADLVRLESLQAMMERAAVGTDDPEQTARWYRAWVSRWMVLRNRLRGRLLLAGPTGQTQNAELDLSLVEQRAFAVARGLGTENALSQVAKEKPTAHRPGQLWLGTQDRPVSFCCATSDETGATKLECRSTGAEGLSGRLTATAAVVGLTLLTLVGVRRGVFSGLACRWPHVVGVAFGLLWWLCLQPSILGWGIVLISVVAGFQSKWKRPRRPSPTTIVPLSLADR